MTLARRLLLIRPDSYGDIVLFEPVLRRLLAERPEWSVFLLVRSAVADVAGILPVGVKVMTTDLDPYREAPPATGLKIEQLRKALSEIDPTDVISPGRSKTWLDLLVCRLQPAARRWSLGPLQLGLVETAYLELRFGSDISRVAAEVVKFPPVSSDWEASQAILAPLGLPFTAPLHPRLHVESPVAATARDWLTAHGMVPGAYLICAPAGIANVSIKAWPAEKFGEVIGQIRRSTGIQTVIVGHESEATIVSRAAEVAAKCGASPHVWLGRAGDFPVLAALCAQAKAFLGNDTGALHVAAAAGIPVVGLYGGGTWPRFVPATTAGRALVAPLPCFGCDWDCRFGDAPCVKHLPIEKVVAATKQAVNLTLRTNEVLQVAAPADILDSPQLGEAQQVRSVGAEILSHKERNAVIAALKTGIATSEELEGTRHALNLANAQRDDLHRQFSLLQTDYVERGRVIDAQGRNIQLLQAEMHSRLQQLEHTFAERETLKNERNLLQAQLSDLRRNLELIEKDRAARGRAIDDQGKLISSLQSEVHIRLDELYTLYTTAETLKNDRNLLQAQLEDLRRNFDLVEQDRIARGQVIEDQGKIVSALEAEVHTRLQELNALYRRLETTAAQPHTEGASPSLPLDRAPASIDATAKHVLGS